MGVPAPAHHTTLIDHHKVPKDCQHLALCATVHLNTALKLITEVMGEPMHDTTRHAALECAETHIRAARAALDVIYERQSNHLPDFKSRAAGEHQ